MLFSEMTAHAYVLTWAQMRIDGVPIAPSNAFAAGSLWSWQGEKIEVPGGAITLERAVSKAVAWICRDAQLLDGTLGAAPFVEKDILLSEGHRLYRAMMIRAEEVAQPLVVFAGAIPDAGRELTICGSDQLQPEQAEPLARPVGRRGFATLR